MANFSEDFNLLDELYRSTKATADKKTDKNGNANIDSENDDMAGLSTAYNILKDEAVLQESGMNRDVSDISKGNEIFPELKGILERSGRSSNSKYMSEVVDALDDYLSDGGVSVDLTVYKYIKENEPDDERALRAASDDIFTSVMKEVTIKMEAFRGAADDYITERTENTTPWTVAGKQRRAMVRAALIQMDDQRKQFAEKMSILRDNIQALLETAVNNGEDSLNLSAHVLVRDLLAEEQKKQNAKEIDEMAKEIATRIAADEEVAGNSEAVGDFAKASMIFNNGLSDKDKEKFDITEIYKEYQTLRGRSPQNFATQPGGVANTMASTEDRIIFEDTKELRSRKAKISAMFYLMTGTNLMPEFIYFWEKVSSIKPNGGKGGIIKATRVFPTSVPELSVGTAMSAEDFVKKITQTFGEDCLSDVKFIKESGGEAAAEGGLQQSDAALWDDLNKSFTDQAINEKALQSGLDKAGTIKVRYLALQKALGALEQLGAPDNAGAGNNDEDVDIE